MDRSGYMSTDGTGEAGWERRAKRQQQDSLAAQCSVNVDDEVGAACQRMPTAGVASICHGGRRGCDATGGRLGAPKFRRGKRILPVAVRGGHAWRIEVASVLCCAECRAQSAERRGQPYDRPWQVAWREGSRGRFYVSGGGACRDAAAAHGHVMRRRRRRGLLGAGHVAVCCSCCRHGMARWGTERVPGPLSRLLIGFVSDSASKSGAGSPSMSAALIGPPPATRLLPVALGCLPFARALQRRATQHRQTPCWLYPARNSVQQLDMACYCPAMPPPLPPPIDEGLPTPLHALSTALDGLAAPAHGSSSPSPSSPSWTLDMLLCDCDD
jgi:hypothetical protein